MEVARWLVAIPAAIAYAIWDRLTRDAEEQFIAEQRERFIRWAEGE